MYFRICAILVVGFCLINCDSKKTVTKGSEKVVSSYNIELIVGTYTNESSEGIYKIAFNVSDGSLINKGLIAEISSPTYVALSSDKQFVYAVGEGAKGTVSGYKWNADRTKLKLINTLSSEGLGACFIELNKKEDLVAVANYSSGNLSLFGRNSDGSLQTSPQVRQHTGSGSALPNQTKPHAHCSKFYNDKFLYVVDLGIDEVASYSIGKNGKLGQKNIALKTAISDGPRHLIFHPTLDISYVINEISNSIIVSEINQKDGTFNKVQKISTLPKEFSGKSHCADIHISADGKFLYASNRGHNSIAIFAVDENGFLTLLGTESVRGDWPRNFTLSPDGKFLLVANQKSDNIVVFNRNKKTGMLSFTGNELKLSLPVCLKF